MAWFTAAIHHPLNEPQNHNLAQYKMVLMEVQFLGI
jgi:hypothetical protein